MIPLRDLERRPGIPIVTGLIVVINVAVWVYVLTLIDRPPELRALYERLAFRPTDFFASLDGRMSADAAVTLITHQFMHAGWLHIAGNMLFLWVFGAAVEASLGRARFLAFYLVAGSIAAIIFGLYQIAIGVPSSLVGASGAISGVLGAYIVLAPRARVRTLVPLGLFMTPIALPAVLVLAEWFGLQLISAFDLFPLFTEASSRVAYLAHVSGFVFGVVFVGGAKVAQRILRPRAQPVAS